VPSMSAPDILDLIDGALADYGTSDDAMRWTPDPPPAPLPAARRRVPDPPPALLVEICALTGYDGYTADAIARHAKTHGLSSPYADVVAQAGRNVQAELAKLLVDRLTPVVRSITAGLTGFFDQLAAGVRAAVGLLSKLLPPQVPPPPARPARVSAMHTAYHHRHRGARRWQ
jgi:cytochrome c1